MLIFSLKRKTVNFVHATKQHELFPKEVFRQQPSWLDRSAQKSCSSADATWGRKAALGSLLMLERTGGTTAPGIKCTSKMPKSSRTARFAKLANNAKAEKTYCRQEDTEEPFEMTSGCHTGLARHACCKAALELPGGAIKDCHPGFPCIRIKSFFGSRARRGRPPHGHHPATHIGCFSSSSPPLGQEHPLAQPGRTGAVRGGEASGTLQGRRRPSLSTAVPWPLAMSVVLMVHVWFHTDKKQPAVPAKQTPQL